MVEERLCKGDTFLSVQMLRHPVLHAQNVWQPNPDEVSQRVQIAVSAQGTAFFPAEA